MFCEYKNLFGEVARGVHAYRIADIAVVDVIATILLALLIHHVWPKYGFGYILLALFLLGIIMHRMFCVRTRIDKLIWP
jgi:hypothetical protein